MSNGTPVITQSASLSYGWKFIGRRKNQRRWKPVSYRIDDLRCSWMDSYYKVDIKKPFRVVRPDEEGLDLSQ